MGDNTLQGFVPADFGKVASPPMTLDAEVSAIPGGATFITHQFSMPSNKDTVNVRSAYVQNGDGNSQTGLSLVLRDGVNNVVIHSETSAALQQGGDVNALARQGVSSSTRIELALKNEVGAELTNRPSGAMVIDLE